MEHTKDSAKAVVRIAMDDVSQYIQTAYSRALCEAVKTALEGMGFTNVSHVNPYGGTGNDESTELGVVLNDRRVYFFAVPEEIQSVLFAIQSLKGGSVHFSLPTTEEAFTARNFWAGWH